MPHAHRQPLQLGKVGTRRRAQGGFCELWGGISMPSGNKQQSPDAGP